MVREDRRSVYATLLTSDEFLVAVQVLIYSLRKVNSIYDIVVLVSSSQVSTHTRNRLKHEEQVEVLPVDDIANPNLCKEPGWINSGTVY